MKKIIVLALAAVLLVGGALTVQAATNRSCIRFVDADNNGVCDNQANCPAASQKDCFVDDNSDGVCDNRASCQAEGSCPMASQTRSMAGCRMGAAGHGGNHHGK